MTSEELNRLFLEGDRAKICLALREIAGQAAAGFKLQESDRQDAISAALILGLKILPKYDPARNRAHAYFFQCMRREIARVRRVESTRRAITQSQLPDARDPLEHRRVALERRAARQAAPRPILADVGSVEIVKKCLDSALSKAHDALGDAEDGPERTRLLDAVDILQQVRKELLGRFNRIANDRARWGQRRIPVE